MAAANAGDRVMAQSSPETVTVTSHSVPCDGGEGALGHPRVWLTLDKDGTAMCPYCSRRFVLSPSAA